MNNYQYPPLRSWDDFEDLCTELFRNEWYDVSTQKHGRQGSKQHGVDLYGKPYNDSGYVGVQCKAKEIYPERSITMREIKNEAKKAESFTPKLDTLIIATTASKNVKIQEQVRILSESYLEDNLFNIVVYFWDDLEMLINKHQSVAHKFYKSNHNNDVEIFKIITEIITYDGLISFLRNTHLDAKFDVTGFDEMNQFIEVCKNPKIKFISTTLENIRIKLYESCFHLQRLIGRHSFPCNHDGSLNEIPFINHTYTREERDNYKNIIDDVDNTAWDIIEIYGELISEGRLLF